MKGLGRLRSFAGRFRWFQVVSGGFRWFQVVSGGFRSFQVVSARFNFYQVRPWNALYLGNTMPNQPTHIS